MFLSLKRLFLITFLLTTNFAYALTCNDHLDDQLLVHYKVNSTEEYYECMGFLHGRDRAWQMDYLKRTVEGRLSEILGKSQIQQDFFMRVLGMNERAEKYFSQMPSSTQAHFVSYAKGVNLGFAGALNTNGYAFKKFGHAPEAWRPFDSISVMLLQSFFQTAKTFRIQMEEEERLLKYGSRAKELFDFTGLPWEVSILKNGEFAKLKKKNSAQASIASSTLYADHKPLLKILDGMIGIGEGSNNWVVAPTLTKSKKAMLANDPHLELVHPPFWYWIHAQNQDINAIGASVPGVPLIISGANQKVSWGLTNSYMKVADLSYVDEKELKDLEVIRPTIWIKVGLVKVPFFLKTFERTKEGLPISPLPGPKGVKTVFRWIGYDLDGKDFSPLFELNKAASVSEVDRLVSETGVPGWNFVFADVQGNIGYRNVGKAPRYDQPVPFGIPHRRYSELRGTRGFTNLLSVDEMPHVTNPAKGFVVTANNRQWPEGFPLDAGNGHHFALRAYRIEELLSSNKSMDVESFRKTQCDQKAVDASFLTPILVKTIEDLELSSLERSILNKLKAWDFEAGLDCEICGVYRHWISSIKESENLTEGALYKILKNNPEEIKSLVMAKFKATVATSWLFEKGILKPWSEIHLNSFNHLAGHGYFDSKPLPTGGDDYSVNPGSTKQDSGNYFRHFQGASQRLVVEMSDPPKVYIATSGSNIDTENKDLNRPDSPWMRWRDCDLRKVAFP